MSAIALQAADIYAFQFGLSQIRTIPQTERQYEISRLQPMPYTVRRQQVDYSEHPRGKDIAQRLYSVGELSWTTDLLAFVDLPANSGRTDQWLLSFDDFLRTYAKEPIRELSHRPAAHQIYKPFKFPYQFSSAQQIAGVSADKIQFFSDAHFVSHDQAISDLMTSDGFAGNILLLSGPGDAREVPLQGNERRDLHYRVLQYDANNIKIEVSDADSGDWLYYADCWHPFWSATVNGRGVTVSKANLGYKAVPLDSGDNVVHFRFYSTRVAVLTSLLNWNALLWVMLTPVIVFWGGKSSVFLG